MNSNQGIDEHCDNAECLRIRDERNALLASIKDLTHAQLIGRDIELGLRAELMQSQIDIAAVRARGYHDLVVTRGSATWKIGSIVLKPVSAGKRLMRRLRK